MFKYLFVISFFVSFSYASSSDILINEISATSYRNFFDEDHDDSDWIELYNKSDKNINLSNYKIYDKNNPDKAWILPDTIIAPKGYLVLFASDKNRSQSDKYHIRSNGYGILTFVTSDEFRYHYTELKGNFEISCRINSLVSNEFWSKAGLMIRESLDPKSKYSGIFLTPDDRGLIALLQRDSIDKYPKAFYFNKLDYPYNWIKLKRQDDSIYFYLKRDGYSWSYLFAIYNQFDKNLFVGVATALGNDDNDINKRLTISELMIENDEIALDELSLADIGLKSKAETSKSKELHTHFKLSSGGETIYLWNNTNELLDKFTYDKQFTNVTFGRYPDGSSNICNLNQISPGYSNAPCYKGITEKVNISHNSGWYDTSINVTFGSLNSQDSIYYTLNGDEPTNESTLYKGENIVISKNTSLKAKIIKDNYISDFSECRSFFINEDFRLPVMAVSIDSLDLWSDEFGLFVEKNVLSEREVKAHFDFFETKSKLSYSSSAGAKLHGNASLIGTPQKSIRFHSRNLYGNDEFQYKFWDNQVNKYVDKLILKNGGQDRVLTFLRDAYASSFVDDFNNSLIMESRPVETYINGNYWGTYILRNRFDEDYLALRFGLEPSLINYIDDDDHLKQGNANSYHDFIKELQISNLTNDSIFNLATDKIDLDNFLEYSVFRIYSAIWDWPGHNHKIWNSPEKDSRWRFVLNDFDIAFGCDNAEAHQNLFRKLKSSNTNFSIIYNKFLENDNFKNLFLNTFADYLNTAFLPDNTVEKLDSLSAIFSKAVSKQQERWDDSIKDWDKKMNDFKSFLVERPQNIYNQIINEFELEGTQEVKISFNIENSCTIQLNSLTITENNWSGIYFKDIPVKITCKPKDGYRFVRWNGDSTIYTEEIEVIVSELHSFEAELEEVGTINDNIVINEIMYKPADNNDCKDWIEIYNNSNIDQDISGWKLKDNEDDHIFEIENGTILKKGDFLVLTEDMEKFRQFYPDTTIKLLGNFDFGFGRGDDIRIFNKFDELVDSVGYAVSKPWDNGADGTGFSLELINPNFDNTLAENWRASIKEGGSPGKANDIFLSVPSIISDQVIKIYPSPATDYITINFSNKGLKPFASNEVKVEIYDVMGVLVAQTSSSVFNGQTGTSDPPRIDISNLSPGVYFVKIVGSNGACSIVEKFVKY